MVNHLLSLWIFCNVFVAEADRDFAMCGTWLHGGGSRTLDVDLKAGCTGINISANASTLSVRGSITARCVLARAQALNASRGSPSSFCVFWEPLLDRLVMKLNEESFILCDAGKLQRSCCTHLSPGHQTHSQVYGIVNSSLLGDPMRASVMAAYEFNGETIDCSKSPSSHAEPKRISSSRYFCC